MSQLFNRFSTAKHYSYYNQGSGIGGRGVYPPGRKNFENTPPPEDFGKIYIPPSAARCATAIFLART